MYNFCFHGICRCIRAILVRFSFSVFLSTVYIIPQGGIVFLKKINTLTTSPIPISNPIDPLTLPVDLALLTPQSPIPRPNPTDPLTLPPRFFLSFCSHLDLNSRPLILKSIFISSMPHKQSLQVCSYLLV